MKTFLCIFLLATITFSCQKELQFENILSSIPTVITSPATSITSTTAASGGNITDNGGVPITARGVCWSTSPNPVLSGSHTTDGTGSGLYGSSLTGLTANTIYYVRAYATNSVGTAYGNEISFTTTNTTTALPTVITSPLSSLTMTTAGSGGDVTNDGGAAVTVRGVCWSTTANPTIALSTKTTDGSGTGAFTSAITGLTANTMYHVRAYATNSVGTSYGGDSTFITASEPTIPVIVTTALSAITNTTASSGGTISSDGGAPVTARGVCWSTTAGPTVALSTKTTDGTGIGTFTSAITSLTANTTYHVRAYATNSIGTAYGNDLSFTTGSSTPDVYVAGNDDHNLYQVATIWKNGVPTLLDNSTPTISSANSVYVSGSDVYVAGDKLTPLQVGIWYAAVWKNGVESYLTDGTKSAGAFSVFVSGTDVYVAGFENSGAGHSIAKLWKNGVATSLTNGSNDAMAYSVAVSGTDVYVSGYEFIGTKYVAKLWKNGVASSLTNGTNDAEGYNVFVSGPDVYVAGYESNGTKKIAKLWKNGIASSITNGTNDAEVSNVFVSGSDVYVSGYESNGTATVAKIWKNGVATSLTSGANDAYASAVYIYGTDVYVTGYESNGTYDVAKVWKNGVVTNLTNGVRDGEGYSIFVK